MKVYKKIHFGNKNAVNGILLVGEPVEKEEFDKMFRLRYEIYSQHGYIDEELYPDKQEKDEYDLDGKSKYFIAMIGDAVVGSLRIIQDYYLPTEKECFEFIEPDAVRKIPRDRRMEIGRLIARKYKVGDDFLPRHLILFGLFLVTQDFSLKNNIDGGYAFIKDSLKKKFDRLAIPFHKIEPYKEIYRQGVLRRYFDQKDNPVIPIYFLVDETQKYFARMNRFRLLLVKISENEYKFRRMSTSKILLWKFLAILNKVN